MPFTARVDVGNSVRSIARSRSLAQAVASALEADGFDAGVVFTARLSWPGGTALADGHHHCFRLAVTDWLVWLLGEVGPER